MTIGALATSLQRDGNEDFDCLVACRNRLSETLGINSNDVGEETMWSAIFSLAKKLRPNYLI